MVFLPAVLMLFLFGFSYTSSLSLTMNTVYGVTECQAGLRVEQDRLVFTGAVNLTGVQASLWERHVSLVVGSASSGQIVKDLCNVAIDNCTDQETSGCYCKLVHGRVYNVFFNLTATEHLINRSVRMLWSRRDFKMGKASNWLDVPKIYKTKSEVNILQVNLENISLSQSCKVPAKHSLSYMQYCCFNAPSPCVSTINSKGMIWTGSPCAVGHFIIGPNQVYKLSHAVCGQDSTQTFSCVGESVGSSNVQVEDVQEAPQSSYNGYRNAAIFLASVIAIGLIIATVHRLDARLLFASGSRRRMETMSIIGDDRMSSSSRPFYCC